MMTSGESGIVVRDGFLDFNVEEVEEEVEETVVGGCGWAGIEGGRRSNGSSSVVSSLISISSPLYDDMLRIEVRFILNVHYYMYI